MICFANQSEDLEKGNPDDSQEDFFALGESTTSPDNDGDDGDIQNDPFLPSNSSSLDDCQDPPTGNSSVHPTSKPTKPFHLQPGLPPSFRFQLQFSSLLHRHKTDLKLHGDIIILVQQNSIGGSLTFSSDNLQNRTGFVKSLGKNFQTDTLKHRDMVVPGARDGSKNSVAVFSLEAMILSLLLDESIMHPDNIAEGYDLLTGKSTGPNDHYGEIYTGDAWEPAVHHYCGDDPLNMPIALVIFTDESHFDSKGTLKTLPIMFTLSLFNQKIRNNVWFL
jgi:hypothetical protein